MMEDQYDELVFPQRLQRIVRVQRARASRHAFIGLVVVLALLAAPLHDHPVPVEPWPGRISADDGVEVVALGELRFGAEVGPAVESHGAAWLLELVEPLTTVGDVTSAPWAHLFHSGPLAGAPPETALASAHAGVDVVAPLTPLGDDQQLVAALEVFDEAGLEVTGAGATEAAAYTPAVLEAPSGDRVAVLGFSDRVLTHAAGMVRPGLATTAPRKMIATVAAAAAEHDLVVVHVRFGTPFDMSPDPRQTELARALVDAGADLVVGHGPYLVQPVEIYRGAVIAYSTGSFVAGQGWGRAREAFVLRFRKVGGVSEVLVEPLAIREGRPGQAPAWRAWRIRSSVTGHVDGATPASWRRTDTGGLYLRLPPR
jgi:gamma-polyglutamate biosynthesis protein CapA